MKKIVFFSTISLFLIAILSCSSTNIPLPSRPKRQTEVVLSRKLIAPGFLTAREMHDFFMEQNPSADSAQVMRLAQHYIIEGAAEYINYAVAFAQMCLETGYLRFGNLVTPDMHNYCGLGAMDAAHPGERFETEQLGVRAHIQHLQAYATTEEVKLNKELVDPRYSWVHKTKYVESIEGLAGTWATDPHYAEKIEAILQKIEAFVNE